MHDYFTIQARVGVTKHMGGMAATRTLLTLCQVGADTDLLVIGVGNGVSAARIARRTGCRVTGIDVSMEMLQSATVNGPKGAAYCQGDAQRLPLAGATFDAILSESVTAFTDPEQAFAEYHRVLRPGGYLGINEVTWLEAPTGEFRAYAREVIGGLMPHRGAEWIGLLQRAGFEGVTSDVSALKGLSQALGELQMQGRHAFRTAGLFFKHYVMDTEYRRMIHKLGRDAARMPKGFMAHFGFGLYSGRKPADPQC